MKIKYSTNELIEDFRKSEYSYQELEETHHKVASRVTIPKAAEETKTNSPLLFSFKYLQPTRTNGLKKAAIGI